jgi:hypothetical protein
MKDIGAMMRQAQQMQAKIADAQRQFEELAIDGASGGGLVQLTITGKGLMTRLKIDPSLLNEEEHEILEDLVKAAYEDARRKMEEKHQETMKAATAGMGMLPGFKLPF